ncbi:carboxymuconolactone decarboxylase family protein [Mycobacterium sp. NPDC003449]
MARLSYPHSIDDAPEASQPALRAVHAQLGFTPNSFKLMALSPATLSGVIALQGASSHTVDHRTRDVVALAVSQVNECDYCLTAHSYAASAFGHATDDDIALARQGRSTDPKRAAAGAFARRVIEERGRISDADLSAVRAAGYSDKQIVELVTLAVQFMLTNVLNNVAETDIDFPPVATV